MNSDFKKHVKGSSGPYTDSYHSFMGKTPWIYVKRLLPRPPTESANLRTEKSKNTHDTKNSLPHHVNSDPPSHLSEGDIATVFSQFGEVVDVRFVRHARTGRFLGTAFVCFADYRSGIAASNDMNSNDDSGELCVLYSNPEAPGIRVERCQEVEVPPPFSDATYDQWLSRCDKSRVEYFW